MDPFGEVDEAVIYFDVMDFSCWKTAQALCYCDMKLIIVSDF